MTRTDDSPRHPLVVDRDTNLCRLVTREDIVRWERMELKYRNLLAAMREAIGDDPDRG